jgi:hypothetical protein
VKKEYEKLVLKTLVKKILELKMDLADVKKDREELTEKLLSAYDYIEHLTNNL